MRLLESDNGVPYVSSNVKGTRIKFTPSELSEILNIREGDVDLENVNTVDPTTSPLIFRPGEGPFMSNSSITPLAKIVARIISYNIIPKTGSYDHFSTNLVSAVYGILGRVNVDWGLVIFKEMVNEHCRFLPFGAFLSKIFLHFGVDCSSETSVVRIPEYFDKAILSRMKIPNSFISASADPPAGESSSQPPSSRPRSRPRPSSSSVPSESLIDILDRLDSIEDRQRGLEDRFSDMMSTQLEIKDMLHSIIQDRRTPSSGAGPSGV